MRRLSVILLGVVLAGCGGTGATDPAPAVLPEPLEHSVLPDLASRDRDLPPDVLSADAFEQQELAAILDDAGYVGGRERELTGHTDTFDHVIARTLRFGEAEGARTYLDWIAGHAIDLVGRVRPLEPLPIGEDALLLELEPCATCKKQLPTLVVGWRRGGSVGYLLASGRDVDRESVRRLVAAVDASL